MKRDIKEYQPDWLTISCYRPILMKRIDYRRKMISIALSLLPQTKEVKGEIENFWEKTKEGSYEAKLERLGVRISAGKSIIRIEMQGLAFTRSTYFFNFAISFYYKYWKKTSIRYNGVEYEPPRITGLHICKDFPNLLVEDALPLPTDPSFDFRFKYRYKPYHVSGKGMEGFHLVSGRYLIKAYRKDWEVVDNSSKKPLKYKYQKEFYGTLLNEPITRIEIEISGYRANLWLTNKLLKLFYKASKEETRITIDREEIFKETLGRFYKYHRVLLVSAKRKRDWVEEPRWRSFFKYIYEEDDNVVSMNSLETLEKELEKIEKYLTIGIKQLINSGICYEKSKTIFDKVFFQVDDNLTHEEAEEKNTKYLLSKLIIASEIDESSPGGVAKKES